MTVGQKLKELRQRAGLSQRGLAGVAGVPVGTLRDYEQGRCIPSLLGAQLLARALNVSLDVFPLARK